MSVSRQAREFFKQKQNKKEIRNIIEYIESDWGLDYKLFPVQRFILKCFYGLELDAVNRNIEIYNEDKTNLIGKYTEVEYLYHLIKQEKTNLTCLDDVKKHKNNLILVCGRRSGKSTITSAIASYETYRLLTIDNPQEYYKMKKNSKISITCVATGKDQAKEVFDEIKSHYNSVPLFKRHLHNNASHLTSFKTAFDIQQELIPSIQVKARGCQGKGLRGAANIVAIMDEIAHFIQESKSDASDKAVYDAIAPSTATFNSPKGDLDGKIVMISSPLGRSGVFWENYLYAMEKPIAETQTLVIQAPTWDVNPLINSTTLKKEKAKDPASFWCEYGAQFTDSLSSWIEDKQFLMQCIDENLKPKFKGYSNIPHYMGIDLGFTDDGTAIAIGHVNENGEVELDFHRLISPKNPDDIDFVVDDFQGSTPVLDVDKLVDYIVELTKRFYIKEAIFDQASGFSFEQSLAKRGLKNFKQMHISQKRKSDMYQKFKRLLMDKKVRIYNDQNIISELTHLQRKVLTDYMIQVNKPSSGGYKDDLADALARMIHLAYENIDKDIITARKSLGSVGSPKIYGHNPKTYYKNRLKYRNYVDKRPKF